MRIGIVSRFPLAEATRWKQDLIAGLVRDGHEVFVVFGKRSPVDHAKEAVRRATSHRGSRDVRLLAPRGLGRIISRVRPAPADTGHASGGGAPSSGGGAPSKNTEPKAKRLAAFAKQQNLPVESFSSVNSAAALSFITDQKPDLLILAGAEIVRPPLLAIPQLGTLNPHYGPLPEFRGMSAQEWCLFSQVAPAVTIHFVTSGIDTGDIVSVTPLPLQPTDNWVDVRRHCQNVARDALLGAVHAISTDSVVSTRQALAEGSQYFAMHPRLMHLAKRNLESGYWLGSGTAPASDSPNDGQRP